LIRHGFRLIRSSSTAVSIGLGAGRAAGGAAVAAADQEVTGEQLDGVETA
jgi:hypothetical protein